MELKIDRIIKTDVCTIGHFMVNGVFECYCLEPADRGLTSSMTKTEIDAIKVPAKTAVPTGRYRVTKYFSPDHHCEVPLLEGITGFGDVEIHKGNFPADTKACILLGKEKGINQVLGSALAIDAFYPKFFTAIAAGEQVWITITGTANAA